MTKLILSIIVLFIILSSCDTVETYKPEEQEQNTSIAILKLAKSDSILYKKVSIDGATYLLNTKTNLVEEKHVKDTDPTLTFLFVLIVLGMIFLIGFFIGLDTY